jgi:hypothetical protein
VRDLLGNETTKEDQLAGVQLVAGPGPKQATPFGWPLRWLNKKPPDGKIGTLTLSLKHNAAPLNPHQERMLSITGPLLQVRAAGLLLAELTTCPYELTTCPYELTTCPYELTTCPYFAALP